MDAGYKISHLLGQILEHLYSLLQPTKFASTCNISYLYNVSVYYTVSVHCTSVKPIIRIHLHMASLLRM